MAKVNRRQEILEVLAHELEQRTGSRITTSALARAVGVSEAALYRHFPSKARMFEELIAFAEETVFGRISLILEQEQGAQRRCELILTLLLTFAERNPGITRVLLGDALVGEHDRLHTRVGRFFDRLETQLRQVIREATLGDELRNKGEAAASAALLLAVAEGLMSRYVRSGFRDRPTGHWEAQWRTLREAIFRT
ncbi:MAG: nucleoid occlusion factor SlmA [Gammaproteobacteria bacterium]|nr:MAG: nucleoid occlusion factor SlmA [Gammaproteobacteria bacterium]